MGVIGTGGRRTRAIIAGSLKDPMPDTFAEMKTMLVQGVPRNYTVQQDEFHGMDNTLIYFNGEKIFAFGVIIDESEQPIFN